MKQTILLLADRYLPGGFLKISLVLCLSLFMLNLSMAQATGGKGKTFTVEYYYKVKWGYADEFIRLFKKNHYPVLKKEMELGRILNVTAVKPIYHGTETERWDYRVTIVWKNIETTRDGFDEKTMIKQLFPDQETFEKEEQKRFEILLAHWDLPIEAVDLTSN